MGRFYIILCSTRHGAERSDKAISRNEYICDGQTFMTHYFNTYPFREMASYLAMTGLGVYIICSHD